MHRVAPQCSAAPLHLVAKPVKDASVDELDPRGAYIIQQDSSMIIWKVRHWQIMIAMTSREQCGLLRLICMPAAFGDPAFTCLFLVAVINSKGQIVCCRGGSAMPSFWRPQRRRPASSGAMKGQQRPRPL